MSKQTETVSGLSQTVIGHGRLPWRIQRESDGGSWEVWTREDNTPGSMNNYVVADGIQFEEEANLLAAAPAMFEALHWVLSRLAPDDANGAQCKLYSDSLGPNDDDQTVVEYLHQTIAQAQGKPI